MVASETTVPSAPLKALDQSSVPSGLYEAMNGVDGKVMKIANQENKDLATHAGHAVKVTGELKGDTITVSTIEMQK